MFPRSLAWIGFCFAALTSVFAQDLRVRDIPSTQAEMHARVVALYSFHPAQLTDEGRTAKSKLMDIFWSEVGAKPEQTLPLLRVELRREDAPNFFFTDGSQLLLSLSKSKPDEELAASVLPKTDLADTQSTAYFYEVHSLASDGVDITAAVLHTLERSDFSVSVPQHAMVLDRRTALMYLLLSSKEDLWVKAAMSRFQKEKDNEAKIALIYAITYSQTDEGDRWLLELAKDSTQSAEVQREAGKLAKEAAPVPAADRPDSPAVLKLREQRRARLKAVSDEAMDDVQSLTAKIARQRRKKSSAA